MTAPISCFTPNTRANCNEDGRLKMEDGFNALAPAIFHLPFALVVPLCFASMFDIVKPQIATAADKLTHLRRFL